MYDYDPYPLVSLYFITDMPVGSVSVGLYFITDNLPEGSVAVGLHSHLQVFLYQGVPRVPFRKVEDPATETLSRNSYVKERSHEICIPFFIFISSAWATQEEACVVSNIPLITP